MADFTDRVKQAILKALNGATMKLIGDNAADIIRLRTRLGYGAKAGAREKLASLAESTTKSRARFKRKGLLSQYTTPGKSNLTQTGQMLESIKTIRASVQEVEVGASGPRTGESISNPELSAILEKSGNNRPARPYLELTSVERKQLSQYAQELIRNKIK